MISQINIRKEFESSDNSYNLVCSVEGECRGCDQDTVPLAFLLDASGRTRRVLLIDGRPRWEMRYLKNLFARDEKSAVNYVSAGLDPAVASLPRGEESGELPATAAGWNEYELIVLAIASSSKVAIES